MCLLSLLGAVTSACVAAVDPLAGADSDDAETTSEVVEIPRTTMVPTMQPTSAEALGIALDRTGRPYDNYWGSQGATAQTGAVGSFFVDRGRLEIIGGEAFLSPGPVSIRDTRSIDFRGVEELDLRVIWKQQGQVGSSPGDNDGDGNDGDEASDDGDGEAAGNGDDEAVDESILGLILSVPETTVTRWGEFTKAYQTDDWLGGLTSRSVIEWSARNIDAETPMVEGAAIDDGSITFADIDGDEVDDLLIYGVDQDGDRPGRDRNRTTVHVLAKGFDEADIMVAVIIWHGDYPWRLAVSEGTPPPDITEREDELIDCIEGRRLIDRWGRCT